MTRATVCLIGYKTVEHAGHGNDAAAFKTALRKYGLSAGI